MKSLFSFLAVIVLFLTGCKKGDTGPAGAQGDAGPGGPQGPQGNAGTANVIYSNWFTLPGTARDTTIDNSNMKVNHLAVPKITADILTKGTILVFFTYGFSTFPLPYTSYAGGKANQITFIPVAGKLFITRFTFDNSNSVPLSTILQYRYILIPGGLSARRMKDFHAMTYEEVCEALDIPK